MVIRAVSVAALLSLALCAAAVVIGRTGNTAADARVDHMRMCGDQPCLMGVAPGVTEWSAVAVQLATLRSAQTDSKRVTFTLDTDEGGLVETYVSVNGRTVGRIYLSILNAPALSAGWIIQRYGVPCGVSLYYGAGMLTLRYPQLLANVQLVDGHFDLYSPVSTVRYFDPDFVFESQPDPCVDNITSRQTINTHWLGFTNTGRIMQALMQGRSLS